jgi:hypothetical protein
MAKKTKFTPILTRIKLNPEQAVLTCNCHNFPWQGSHYGYRWESGSDRGNVWRRMCVGKNISSRVECGYIIASHGDLRAGTDGEGSAALS